MTDRSASPGRRDRQGLPLWLFLLPVLLAVAVGAVQNRDEPRSILVPHHALSADALRAFAVRALPDAETASTAAPSRTLVEEARAPHAPVLDAATYVRQREQSAAQLADEALGDLQEGHDGEALNAATACLLREPSEPRCLRVAAVASMHMGQFEQARPYVDRCLHEAPDDPRCLGASAQLAIRDRDLTLAGITIWRLSQIEPDSVDTYMSRAQLSELRNDTANATRYYRSACEAGQPFACRRLGELVSASSAE